MPGLAVIHIKSDSFLRKLNLRRSHYASISNHARPVIQFRLNSLHTQQVRIFLVLLLLSLLSKDSGVGVQTKHNLLVLERVLLLDSRSASDSVSLGSVDRALDFRAVDQASKIGLRDNVGRKEEVTLVGGSLGGGTVDAVESLESTRGPDDESTKVTTRSELEEVESSDGAGLDTSDVAESGDELLAISLGGVDDKRATSLAVAAATELALTGTELLGVLDLADVLIGTDSLQETESGRGLGNGSSLENSRVDNQRNLRDGVDLVSTGLEQRDGRGGSEGGAHGVSLLAGRDLDVPLAPNLGRGEHASGTAHVTEGSLTSAVSTATRNPRNTSNSTTGTPRLSRGLVTSLLAHGVGLTLVLGHSGVNLLDNVRSDRAGEDSRNGVGSSGGSTIFAENGDGRSGSHCEG
jgi:hypothetical protein